MKKFKVKSLLVQPRSFAFDIEDYNPLVAAEVAKKGCIRGIESACLHFLPSFIEALFIVNGQYFVAKSEPVGLSKYSKGHGETIPKLSAIRVVHLKAKKNERRMVVQVPLNEAVNAKGLTIILK